MIQRLLRACMVIVVSAGFTLPAHAGFTGKTLDAAWYFPDLFIPYAFASANPSTFMVGAGVESTIGVEGVTTIIADFSDDALRLDFGTVLSAPTWNSASFNGLVFSVLAGGALDFSGMQVGAATTLAGFDASRVSFDATSLALDFGGLAYVDGTVVQLLFTSNPASIPLPGSAALLGLGLAGLAAARRKRVA